MIYPPSIQKEWQLLCLSLRRHWRSTLTESVFNMQTYNQTAGANLSNLTICTLNLIVFQALPRLYIPNQFMGCSMSKQATLALKPDKLEGSIPLTRLRHQDSLELMRQDCSYKPPSQHPLLSVSTVSTERD